MNLVFDTSALSKLLAKNEEILKAASSQSWERLIIPLASDAEIRSGFNYSSKAQQNLRVYEEFVKEFAIEIAQPDQTTSIVYADLATWCRKQDVSLSQNDLWIAACAVQNTARLLTLDADFEQLPQLTTVQI